MPDFPPLVIVLEGEYSDWAIYDSFDDTDAYDGLWAQEACINREETEIVLIDAASVETKKYTIATKTVSPSILTGALWHPSSYTGAPQRSIQQTYLAFLWASSPPYTAKDRLSIVKNGIVIKTLTNSELGFGTNYIRSVSISRSGKYVVASGRRAATGNMGWVILEGS